MNVPMERSMPLHPYQASSLSYRAFHFLRCPTLVPMTHRVRTSGLAIRLTVASLCLAFVVSCSSLSGYPPASTDQKAELKSLQQYFSPDKTNSCADKQCRNDIITGRLRAVDLNYY